MAAVAAATALCLAPSAEAAGKRLVGVNGIPPPNAAQMTRLAVGGTNTIRILVSWRLVEPFQGARNWAQLDAAVANAASAGIEVLPFLYESPAWVSANGPTPPIHSDSARAAWSAFVTDVAARYGRNGSFWAARPDLPRRPFVHYQVWNEVNLSYFWGGRPNPRRYAQLVRITSRGLKAADPGAKILLAGLIPYKTVGAGSVAGTTYLRRLLRIRKLRKHVDAVAVHPYGKRPRVVMAGIQRTRQALDKVRGRKLPIWVTEFGWTTGGELWEISPVRADPRQQAVWVKRTYRLMRKSAKRLRLRRALYFNYADFDGPGIDYWNARMGLFDLNDQPKPAWFAYVRRAGGTP